MKRLAETARVKRLALAALLAFGSACIPAAAQPPISWTLFPNPPPGSGGKEPAGGGAAAFHRACSVCHGAPNSPGTVSLGAKYQGVKPAMLEQRTDLTPQVVLFYIRQGVAMMAPFRKTELSDADATAIGAYLSRKDR